jgi:hypothetical protein
MDHANGAFDTKIEFAIYGGKGAFSNPVARNMNPVKGYDSGVILDGNTFGQFNPKEGQFIKALDTSDKYYLERLFGDCRAMDMDYNFVIVNLRT